MKNNWLETRKYCPACNAENFRTIYENQFDQSPIKDYLLDFYSQRAEFKYLEGASYILCECENCGLIFQRDIPNKALMERLYGQWIDITQSQKHDDQQMDLLDRANNSQEILQIISYFRKNPSSLRFLDFGMGTAKWALMAKGLGCQSYGIELVAELIEHARSKGINVITWDDIPKHRFDFIHTEQVFEHLPEPLETLCHLIKSLETNGMIKICVPTANDIDRRLKIMDWKSSRDSRNSLNPVAPLEHINYFKRSSILKIAEEAGMHEVFMPIKIQYRYSTDWDGIKKIAKNLIRPIYRNILKKQNYILLQKTH